LLFFPDGGHGSYKEELDLIHHQLQAHRAHLAAARNLRQERGGVRGHSERSKDKVLDGWLYDDYDIVMLENWGMIYFSKGFPISYVSGCL